MTTLQGNTLAGGRVVRLRRPDGLPLLLVELLLGHVLLLVLPAQRRDVARALTSAGHARAVVTCCNCIYVSFLAGVTVFMRHF